MGTAIEVTSENFATAVLQQSYDKPVLVDFFAQWCGPCQMLKPVLERLMREYDFVLAKVDIDQNPDLASQYEVEGVPDVKICVQGQMQNGFVGVLPEPELRSLLAKFNLHSDLEAGLEALKVATSTGDTPRAQQLLSTLSEQYPEDRRLILAAAKFLIQRNRIESATKLLSAIQPSEREHFVTAEALRNLIQLQQLIQEPVIESELDEQFFKATRLILTEDYESALQILLELVSRDRKYRSDGARKTMLTIFDLLGDSDPLTKDYRKQLMLTLY